MSVRRAFRAGRGAAGMRCERELRQGTISNPRKAGDGDGKRAFRAGRGAAREAVRT